MVVNALQPKLKRRDRTSGDSTLQALSESRVDSRRRNQIKLTRRAALTGKAFAKGGIEGWERDIKF